MKRLFAHRGMSSLAPENTLSAFSLCRQHGIDWFECDVDIIADGTVIVIHDDTLDRCSNKNGSIYSLTREDLQHIDAGGWFSDEYLNEPLPTLHHVIDIANRDKLNFNLEIKACAQGWGQTVKLIDGCLYELTRLDPERTVIVSSFNHLLLAEFKRRCPEVAIACLFEQANFWGDWQSILQACQADAVHLEDKKLTKLQVSEIKKAGYLLNVYTVNDLARANELFNWGVDGIFTDIPQKFPSKYKNKP